MKVELTEKEIETYHLKTEIEVEGEIYRATIRFDIYDGYSVRFWDLMGRTIDYPGWATKLEEELTEPLGYWLECQIEGFFTWGKVETSA